MKSFSINLENTTVMFPELAEIADELHADEVILDSEAVGDVASGSSAPLGGLMLFTRGTAPTYAFYGDILEVLLYNVQHTAEEMAAVHSALNARNGVY